MPEQTNSQAADSGDSGFSPGIASTQALRNMDGPPEPDTADRSVDRTDSTDDEAADLSGNPTDESTEQKAAATAVPAEVDPLQRLPLSEKWIKENPELYETIRTALAPKSAAVEEHLDVAKILQERFAELEKPAETAKPAQDPAAPHQPQADTGPIKFGDIGDTWNSIDDAYKQRQEADLAGEHRKVAEIDKAVFARNFWDALPGLVALFDRRADALINARVPAPVLQEATLSRHQRVDTEGRESAERFLTEKLGDAFTAMLRNDNGPDLVIGGRAMDPNVYNRIVAEHPHIGEIQKSHANPVTAREMTWAARYAAAFKIHRMQAAQSRDVSKAAETLAKASAASATRTERERTRSSVHAGGRSNGQLEGSRKPSAEEDEGDLVNFIRENSPGASTRRLRSI